MLKAFELLSSQNKAKIIEFMNDFLNQSIFSSRKIKDEKTLVDLKNIGYSAELFDLVDIAMLRNFLKHKLSYI